MDSNELHLCSCLSVCGHRRAFDIRTRIHKDALGGIALLHKCANPACLNPFRKLSQGKLFLVETPPLEEVASTRKRSPSNARIEYYWLCDECAFVLTLSYEEGQGVVAVPRPRQRIMQRVALTEAVKEMGRPESRRAEQS